VAGERLRHFAAYLTVVFLVVSPVKAVVFILVQQGLFGAYLGASFAPHLHAIGASLTLRRTKARYGVDDLAHRQPEPVQHDVVVAAARRCAAARRAVCASWTPSAESPGPGDAARDVSVRQRQANREMVAGRYC
jgi:hypothetical protein